MYNSTSINEILWYSVVVDDQFAIPSYFCFCKGIDISILLTKKKKILISILQLLISVGFGENLTSS